MQELLTMYGKEVSSAERETTMRLGVRSEVKKPCLLTASHRRVLDLVEDEQIHFIESHRTKKVEEQRRYGDGKGQVAYHRDTDDKWDWTYRRSRDGQFDSDSVWDNSVPNNRRVGHLPVRRIGIEFETDEGASMAEELLHQTFGETVSTNTLFLTFSSRPPGTDLLKQKIEDRNPEELYESDGFNWNPRMMELTKINTPEVYTEHGNEQRRLREKQVFSVERESAQVYSLVRSPEFCDIVASDLLGESDLVGEKKYKWDNPNCWQQV